MTRAGEPFRGLKVTPAAFEDSCALPLVATYTRVHLASTDDHKHAVKCWRHSVCLPSVANPFSRVAKKKKKKAGYNSI